MWNKLVYFFFCVQVLTDFFFYFFQAHEVSMQDYDGK
jgi:hypothetical protein